MAGAVGCYLAGLACIGIVYHYYAPHASCGLNIFLITWTLIWGMIFTVLSVSSCRALPDDSRTMLRLVPCHAAMTGAPEHRSAPEPNKIQQLHLALCFCATKDCRQWLCSPF